MKSYPTEALTHTPITATLYLLREHGLQAEQVKEVRIETIARAADILSDPAKYDPRTKEAADHSLPYCIAAAIARRQGHAGGVSRTRRSWSRVCARSSTR